MKDYDNSGLYRSPFYQIPSMNSNNFMSTILTAIKPAKTEKKGPHSPLFRAGRGVDGPAQVIQQLRGPNFTQF